MVSARYLALASVLTLATSCATNRFEARPQWPVPVRSSAAFLNGYDRGERAGQEDWRRGDRFDYTDELDYRRGDVGYRSQYGSRDRYREDYRGGFQLGYRDGYGQGSGAARAIPRSVPPTVPGERGRYGYPSQSVNFAWRTGFDDGYNAGFDDGRHRRRVDPVGEGRYRSADHGYARQYGSKDQYKLTYREGFRAGYAQGYQDGSRR